MAFTTSKNPDPSFLQIQPDRSVYSIPVIGNTVASRRRTAKSKPPLPPLLTRPRVDFKVLRPLQKFTPPIPLPAPQMMKLDLFNAQSIGNKASLLHRHIIDNDLDVLCLTECWHEPGVFLGLNKLCPPGFKYIVEPVLAKVVAG